MAARGGGAKSGGALPNLRSFGPKTAIFRPKQPQYGSQAAKRRQTAPTLHMRLDFLVTKGPLVPSNSTICPRNGPKRRQKAPKTAQYAPTPRNQERAVSWATWLKIRFRGHPVHPQPPTFCGFQASESPNETRRPPYQWSLGAAGGPASPRTVGANRGSTRVPRAKKMIFSKVVPRPLGMLKQVFFGRFEPVVARFGPWKLPKSLENGRFGTNNASKMGQKRVFPKMIRDHLRCSNKCFEPILSPWRRVLAHGKSPNALKMGHFGTKNGSKMGQKCVFPKVIPDHLGCSNKCF